VQSAGSVLAMQQASAVIYEKLASGYIFIKTDFEITALPLVATKAVFLAFLASILVLI